MKPICSHGYVRQKSIWFWRPWLESPQPVHTWYPSQSLNMTFIYPVTIHHVMNRYMHNTHTYKTHAFMQGDYANAPTETEALTSFLDDYKDAMENRKAGGRSFRWRRWCILLSFLKYGFCNYELMNSGTLVSWSFPDIWIWRGVVQGRRVQTCQKIT